MSLPDPVPGLVLRYSYLWAKDAAAGAEEGDKDRPAAIVMTVARGSQTRVFALAITHSAPAAGTEAMEVPAAVCKAAGLDAGRSWIVLSEFNEFLWPGFDIRPIPGHSSSNITYGFLTPGFFRSVRNRWLELDAQRQSKPVLRDE